MTEGDWSERPVLRGDLVTLRPLTGADAAGVLAAADDDEVFRWLRAHRPTTISQAQTLVDGTLRLEPQRLTWAQTLSSTGEIAGMTSFYDIDPELRTVAIGWTWLGKRFWRTGVNREAKRLLLTHAFETLGCVRVVWHVDILNERSQAAVEALGATREGILRKHKLRLDGTWRDTVTYSLLDTEWLPTSPT